MSTLIEIEVVGPIFWSHRDEAHLFAWASEIPGVVSVGGRGLNLVLEIDEEAVTDESLRELLAVFHRYQLEKRPLARFDSGQRPWFRDRKMYWFNDVFGDR